MVVKIKDLTFEQWEAELQRIMEAKRVRKKPVDPYHYWQAGYPAVLAFEDMFPEEAP